MLLPIYPDENDCIWSQCRQLMDDIQRIAREKEQKSLAFRLKRTWENFKNYPAYLYRKRKIRRMKKSAVCLHLYYTDLADEFIKILSCFPSSFDLFVTTCRKDPNIDKIKRAFPNAQIWVLPNRGRDVGPFIETLNRINLNDYEVIFKIHSKKVCLKNEDGKRNEIIRFMFNLPDGESWRKELVNSFMGSRYKIMQVLYMFHRCSNLGMLGGDKFLKTHGPLKPREYFRLCRVLEIPHHYEFFAGTMFAVRAKVLQRLKDKKITLNDFCIEQGELDGKLEDIVASCFGALCRGQNYTVTTI